VSLKKALSNNAEENNSAPDSDRERDHKDLPPVKEEGLATAVSNQSQQIEVESSPRGTKRGLEESQGEGNSKVGVVKDAAEEFDDDNGDNDDAETSATVEDASPEVLKAFKDRVKAEERKQLDTYAQNVQDKVRLHEEGWKNRYYTDKCKADDVAAHGGREHLFRSYVLGLCWVMKYYYDGCPSWKWYYPFHYAPFASDLRNIERFENDVRSLESSAPFNPVEQLMAVLPSDSSHAIPKEARWLMSDVESPILDFYPTEVPVDPNGKAMPWLWVVLLPFINEDRLLGALTPSMAKWTKAELLCNSRGLDDGYLFIHVSHALGSKIRGALQGGKTAKSPKTRLTDQSVSPGFVGAVRPPLSNEIHTVGDDTIVSCPAASQKAEFTSLDNLFTEPLVGNDVLCVAFTNPLKLSHKSIIIPGAIPPPPSLNMGDKNIGRPRLNRGGGTIANMGSSNGQSFKNGYGSMNISSHERDLANRTGRGNQMYQAGTRAWGAMEPTPKRFRPQNPFNGGGGGPHSSQHGSRPPWQAGQGPPQHRQNGQQQQYRGQQAGQQQQFYQYRQQPHQQNHNQGYHNPQAGRGRYPPQGHRQAAPPHSQNPQGRQQGQGFNFQSHRPNTGRHHPPQNSSSTQVNSTVMNSLRTQLASTLKQNRNQGNKR